MATFSPLYLLLVITSSSGLLLAQPVSTFTILDSQEVDLGSHSIIYNRVAIPKLKPEVEDAPISQPLSLTLQAPEDTLKPQRCISLFFFATVYGDQVSEVHCWQGNNEYVVLSSINFDHLRALSNFESKDSSYFLNVSVSDDPHLKMEASNTLQLKSGTGVAAAFEGKPSSYVIISATQNSAAQDFLHSMEDLHRYYDSHREKLIQISQASAAQEQWQKDHPPKPQDTIINYFSIPGNQ